MLKDGRCVLSCPLIVVADRITEPVLNEASVCLAAAGAGKYLQIDSLDEKASENKLGGQHA